MNISKHKYHYIEQKNKDYTSIQLSDGIFKDTIISYGKIKFDEDKKNNQMKLKFEYDILENPHDVDKKNKLFTTIVGDILVDIIDKELNGLF